jgi:hypothetical protein
MPILRYSWFDRPRSPHRLKTIHLAHIDGALLAEIVRLTGGMHGMPRSVSVGSGYLAD